MIGTGLARTTSMAAGADCDTRVVDAAYCGSSNGSVATLRTVAMESLVDTDATDREKTANDFAAYDMRAQQPHSSRRCCLT
jgi:hypothetical protein